MVAGGRAIDALRSVTVAQHLFGIERIVIVHHTYCGATSFTADGIIEAYAREQGTDIGSLYPRDSICITDYVTSLRHDVRLMRTSAGTPRQRIDLRLHVRHRHRGAVARHRRQGRSDPARPPRIVG